MEKLVACSELQLCQNLRIKARQFQEAFKESPMDQPRPKVRNNDSIKVVYLWRFVTWGAMVLCANGQCGVDLVVTVVHSGNVLSSDNTQRN
jgi:hypothetical protein